MKKFSKTFIYTLLAAGISLSSCVSSKKYKALQAQNQELQASRDALSQDKATLEQAKAALEQERAALEKDKAALEEAKANSEKALTADLQSSNQKVSQLSSDLKAREARLLEMQRIDGLHHYVVLDQDEGFAEFLRAAGARSVQSMPVSLDRAVNSFLAKNHAAPAMAAGTPA